jgi:hypothetical protein
MQSRGNEHINAEGAYGSPQTMWNALIRTPPQFAHISFDENLEIFLAKILLAQSLRFSMVGPGSHVMSDILTKRQKGKLSDLPIHYP